MASNLTMDQIINEINSAVAIKKAQFEGMPGSEHDSAVTVPPVDKEVKERYPGEPSTARSTAGRGDNSDLTRGHTLETDEPAKESPVEVAQDSDDAMNAELPEKGAADLGSLANDFLRTIQRYKETEKQAEIKADPKTKKPSAKKEPTRIENIPTADCTQQLETAKETPQDSCDSMNAELPEKGATESDFVELSQGVLAKIAATILSTQEGWDFTEQYLSKIAGEEAAKDTINLLKNIEKTASNNTTIKTALINELNNRYYSIGGAMVENAVKAAQLQGLPEAPAPVLDQMAAMPEEAAPVEQPMEEGPVVPDAGAQGEGSPEDMEILNNASPEELGAAIAELVQEGALDEDTAMQLVQQLDSAAGGGAAEGGSPEEGGGNPEEILAGASPEEIGKALSELVDEGTLDEESASQLAAALDGGGEAGAPAEEAPAEEAPAEEAPAEEAPAEELKQADIYNYIKGASLVDSAVLDYIEKTKQSKEQPAGEESIKQASPEEIGQTLSEMISNGSITPEDAVNIIGKLDSSN